MKPALLVIDIQKQFFDLSPEFASSLKDAMEYINAAIDIFREKDLPVVCIQHMQPKMDLVPGKEGFDSPDDLKVLPTDLHIHKTKGSAFVNTDLQVKLEEMGVDTLIMTGFAAEYCLLSTYRGAQDLDLNPIVLRGSLASENLEHIQFVEKISDIISYGALKHILA